MAFPKNFPPIPKDLNFQKATELREALQIMLPKDLGLSDAAAKPNLKTQNYKWENPSQLSKFVKDITDQDEIKYADYVLSQWQENFSQIPEYEAPTMTGAPEYPVSKTSLTSTESEFLVEKMEERETERKEGTSESNEAVRAAIKRQQQIYAEQLKRTQAAEKAARDKEVYAQKKPTPEPSKTTKKVIEDLQTQLKEDPVGAINAISDKLKERNQDKTIPDEAFKVAAIYTAVNVATPTPAINSAVNEYVAKNSIKIGGEELKDPAQILYRQDSSLRDMSKQLDLVYGKEFVDTIFPEYQISETPQPGYTPVSIAYIPREAAKRIETESAILNKASTSPEIETRDFVERWMNQMGQGIVPQGITAQRLGYQETVTALEYLPQGQSTTFDEMGGYAAMNSSMGMGESLGLVGRLVTQKALGKLGAQVAVKTGLKAAITKITTALSTAIPVPVVNWIVGFIGGEVIGRILEKINLAKIKKWFLVGVGATTAAIGAAFAIPAMTVGGLAMLGVGVARAQGLTAAAVGQGIAGFAGALASATLGTIGIPILATLLGFPVVVALILFIINSGAYIVPQAPSISAPLESPYIGVTKTATPAGPFQNSDLPLTVEYRVEIRAKKGTLTDVKIDYECAVVRDGPTVSCPDPDPAIPTTVNGGISPASAFAFTYKVVYPESKFEDSFVTDVITVTTNTTEQAGAQAAGSATIKIGEPPEECPSIWPTSHGYITQGAKTPSSCGNNCSHRVLEAIDIGVSTVGVLAGHSGAVVTATRDSCLGNYIQIKSNCGGKDFISRYAHLEGIKVRTGAQVTMGQQIGLSGNTGSCTTGPHLHYEFRYWPSGTPNWPKNPPFMMRSYIPEDVPRGCRTTGECGVDY